MKALMLVGVVVLVLGIVSFFVPVPHSEHHGVSVGDAHVGVTTHDRGESSAGCEHRPGGCGGGIDDRRQEKLARKKPGHRILPIVTDQRTDFSVGRNCR